MTTPDPTIPPRPADIDATALALTRALLADDLAGASVLIEGTDLGWLVVELAGLLNTTGTHAHGSAAAWDEQLAAWQVMQP